jgi:hypothetical protein
MKNALICGAVAAALGAVALAVRVLYDVFSLAGLAYAFGIGNGSDLFAPTATRIVFWVLLLVLLVEVPVLVVRRLDWREARLTPVSSREAWFAAHVSLVRRTSERVRFARAGWDNHLQQRARAAAVAAKTTSIEAVPADAPARTVDEDAA